MPGKSKSGGGLKSKKYVMQMGAHSEDSDTTFKAKDQDVINNSLLSRVAAANSSRAENRAKVQANNASRIASGFAESAEHVSRSHDNIFSKAASAAFGFAKGFSKEPTTSAPKVSSTITKPKASAPASSAGSVSKSKSKGQGMQDLFKSLGPVKTKSTTSAPKKQTKTVKPATKSIAAPKSKPVSIAVPKPTASASIPSPKPTVAAAPAKAPKVKESKPNAKKADKSFSKMVKLRTKANIISGDDSMSDKKKQRKLGRLRKRYDRQAAKQKKSSSSIGDAYKVNL